MLRILKAPRECSGSAQSKINIFSPSFPQYDALECFCKILVVIYNILVPFLTNCLDFHGNTFSVCFSTCGT